MYTKGLAHCENIRGKIRSKTKYISRTTALVEGGFHLLSYARYSI